jgi:hypothetical protein
MVTEQGKWFDGEPIFFEQPFEPQHPNFKNKGV